MTDAEHIEAHHLSVARDHLAGARRSIEAALEANPDRGGLIDTIRLVDKADYGCEWIIERRWENR